MRWLGFACGCLLAVAGLLALGDRGLLGKATPTDPVPQVAAATETPPGPGSQATAARPAPGQASPPATPAAEDAVTPPPAAVTGDRGQAAAPFVPQTVPAVEPQAAGSPRDPEPVAEGAEGPAAAQAGDALGAGWQAIWAPFASEGSARGFAGHLSGLTGVSFRVIRVGPGEYRVAFRHEGEDQRRRVLGEIAAAAGLDEEALP